MHHPARHWCPAGDTASPLRVTGPGVAHPPPLAGRGTGGPPCGSPGTPPPPAQIPVHPPTREGPGAPGLEHHRPPGTTEECGVPGGGEGLHPIECQLPEVGPRPGWCHPASCNRRVSSPRQGARRGSGIQGGQSLRSRPPERPTDLGSRSSASCNRLQPAPWITLSFFPQLEEQGLPIHPPREAESPPHHRGGRGSTPESPRHRASSGRMVAEHQPQEAVPEAQGPSRRKQHSGLAPCAFHLQCRRTLLEQRRGPHLQPGEEASPDPARDVPGPRAAARVARGGRGPRPDVRDRRTVPAPPGAPEPERRGSAPPPP